MTKQLINDAHKKQQPERVQWWKMNYAALQKLSVMILNVNISVWNVFAAVPSAPDSMFGQAFDIQPSKQFYTFARERQGAR